MPPYAWVLEVRPGCEDEYKRRHDDVWPEMVQELRAAGIGIYSIFRCGLTLLGYFETDNLAAAIGHLRESDVNRRWAEYMAPIMKLEVDDRLGFPFPLPLQFHMD